VKDFYSNLMLVTELNEINFLYLHSRELRVSTRKVKVPDQFKAYSDDEYANGGVFFINEKSELYVYSGGDQV
jgi:hypothetical protein